MPVAETQVTLTLPADIADHVAQQGDLSRIALEGFVLEAYRERKLSGGQARRILGLETSLDFHAFLKDHDAYLNYGREDLEHDIREGDKLQLRG